MTDAESLVESILDGSRTFESALEEHLDGKLEAPISMVFRTLAYFNLGLQDRFVELDDGSLTVAEFVQEFELTPFSPLLKRSEDRRFWLGDVVAYKEERYQIIGRRAVTSFAAQRSDDWELLVEDPAGGLISFVGESEVDAIGGAESSEN